MTKDEMKLRTKQFGLRIIKVVDRLPNTIAGRKIGDQLIRSGTSVGANYRSATRGRSKREFTAKIGIALEECDEALYWLEMIIEAELIPAKLLKDLTQEADELCRILYTTKSSSIE